MDITTEAWILAGLGLLLGLLLGWLIWGRSLAKGETIAMELARVQSQAEEAGSNRVRLERELAAARDQIKPLADEVDRLRRQQRKLAATLQETPEAPPEAKVVPPQPIAPEAPPAAEPQSIRVTPSPQPAEAPPPVRSAPPEPETRLNDLRLLKGVGEKLVARLNDAGVPDIPALAALAPQDAARIDANLGPLSGRIARDQLIEQARLLAEGRVTEYEARYGRLDRQV